jgi:uncharacterized membrane protein
MALDPLALAAVGGMALATFLLRLGGIWMAGRKASSPFLSTCMRHAPGAILTALLAPLVLAGGLPTVAAAGATVLVSRRTGNFPVAIVAGVGTFATLSLVFP